MKKYCISVLLVSAVTGFALEFSDADIVIPGKASNYLKFAAKELSHHLKKITGGKFNITSSATTPVKIMLGRFPAGFDRKQLSQRDSFAVSAKGNTLYIAGLDTFRQRDVSGYSLISDPSASKGTLAGVHSFVEQHGVRWLAPGEKNTYVYRKKTIKVPEGTVITVPPLAGRTIAGLIGFGHSFYNTDGKEYIGKESYGGHIWGVRLRSNAGNKAFAHSESRLKLGEIWKNHPERFQLMRNGKRNVKYLCWTDPAVAEMWEKAADAFFSGKKPAAAGLPHVKSWYGLELPGTGIFSIDPMDHGASNDGRCRCKRCDEFRRKHPCADDSEIMWQVIAGVAWKMKAKYPGKFIATLVYPPKEQMPKSVKLPDNIKVCICLPGPKTVHDAKAMKKQLDTVKAWSKKIGRENVGIWTYQCEIHGGKLPGVPEYYPEYMQSYLKQMLPYITSMFHEYNAHNLTYRVLETYLQTRLQWDPGVDVKQLKAEYLRLYYGPAAGQMAEITALMEKNWQRYKKVSANIVDPSQQRLGVFRDYRPLKKAVWSKVYDKKEMARINALLTSGEKAAGKTIYGERLKRFRRHVYNYMVKERAEVMDLDDLSPDIALSSAPWAKQKSLKLVSAHRDDTVLKSEAAAQFRCEKGILHIRVRVKEPAMPQVKVTSGIKNGSMELSLDYCFEVFLFTPANNTIHQYIISAGNKASKLTASPYERKWSVPVRAEYAVKKDKTGFLLEFSLPLAVLGKDLKGLKLNITRERHLKNADPEYSTLSPASLLGNWHNTDSYARITIK